VADRSRTGSVAFACALGAFASGCAVGPDYHPPEPPVVGTYGAGPPPAETASAERPAGEAQLLLEGRDVPAEWWTLFRSEALDTLVRQALADSPVLAQATAKLKRAQEDLIARRGATRLPRVEAGVSATRVDVQPESFGLTDLPIDTPFTLYAASVSVSYTLDLFGKSRREMEGLQARVDHERFEQAAARLMIAGNVVTAAIEEASLREQIETTRSIVELQSRGLAILERREALGGVSHLDVVTQRRELARTRASLPDLEELLERTRHRLAVYLGRLPAEAGLPEVRLTDLHLPTDLPLSVPSELVRRRPDILAAEALLHVASADVGVATANLYPRITLSGTFGSLTTALGSLFSGGTGFWLLGGALAQPLFRGGELKAEKRAAVAAFEEAGAAYRQVVLTGFRSVADTLSALDADARALRDRAEAESAARTAFDIASRRYEVGGLSLLELLDAQRQHLSASIEATRAAADRYADSAALFQALGGGWWNEADTSPTATEPVTATEGRPSP
jgi:NodT family efflux transporter outer membrane factor (OMF) lipoprotein